MFFGIHMPGHSSRRTQPDTVRRTAPMHSPQSRQDTASPQPGPHPVSPQPPAASPIPIPGFRPSNLRSGASASLPASPTPDSLAPSSPYPRPLSRHSTHSPAPELHHTSPLPPRPDSPTYLELNARSQWEQVIQNTVGPVQPAGHREMDPGQAAAATMFRNNLNSLDPSGRHREAGEFSQAYGGRDGRMVATTPMVYSRGQAVSLPHPLPPGTEYVVHSHNRPPPHADNNFPSGEDYRSAYLSSAGNSNGVKGEMLYIPHEDRFLYYQGRLNPRTRAPEFHELVNPFRMRSPSPREGSLERARPLPDPATYGQHFIHWPDSDRSSPSPSPGPHP